MTTEESSDQKQVWPKRTPDQHQLFASVDKWLAFLPYLSKPELDKCREVCDWTDWLIGKYSGGELKQRRRLSCIFITPAPLDYHGRQMAPLDIDKLMEDEDTTEKIKAKAQKLIGETIYLYEPEDATVRICIAPQWGQFLYLAVKNRLDEKDALLIARLMPRITPPMAVFFRIGLLFRRTPELPADAPHGGSYLNRALFSLPGNDADGGGGGDSVKLITQYLGIIGPRLQEGLPRGMVRTAELSAQCQEFLLLYNRLLILTFIDFLPQVAVARPLNAPARIAAYEMEDGRLDEILDVGPPPSPQLRLHYRTPYLQFFTHIAIGFESAAPRLRVTIHNPTAWPESLPKTGAINSREEQRAERLYKFRLYNQETGEKLDVEVRGSFGNIQDEGKGEAGLRVSDMVLHFRPDDDE